MDPLYDLVRDRTHDLRRTADAARRERDLRGTSPNAPDHRLNAAAAALEIEPGAEPCLPAKWARAA